MSKQHVLPEPGRWVREELWRNLFPNDEQQATALRRVLYEMMLYPRYDLATNGNLAGQEANYRAALPAIAAALDRTDLVALVEMARLLAVVPRERLLLLNCAYYRSIWLAKRLSKTSEVLFSPRPPEMVSGSPRQRFPTLSRLFPTIITNNL